MYQTVYFYIWDRKEEWRNNTIEIMPRRNHSPIGFERTSRIGDNVKLLPFGSFTRGLIWVMFQDFDSNVKDKILNRWEDLEEFVDK